MIIAKGKTRSTVICTYDLFKTAPDCSTTEPYPLQKCYYKCTILKYMEWIHQKYKLVEKNWKMLLALPFA